MTDKTNRNFARASRAEERQELLPPENVKGASLLSSAATLATGLQPIVTELGSAYRARCEVTTIKIKTGAEVKLSAHRRDETIVACQEAGATKRAHIELQKAALVEAIKQGDEATAGALLAMIDNANTPEVSAEQNSHR